MSKPFMTTTYKNHREQILMDRERNLLPSAQSELEIILTREKELVKLNLVLDEMYSEHRRIERQIMEQRNLIYAVRHATTHREIIERKKFIKPCPIGNCRGFLSSQWKCGLCDSKVCKDCHTLSEDEHKCDPDLVKNVVEISNSTKSCPSCGTAIFFLGGCSQMFCTSCATAFDWRTGRIEKGVIHNPHYYEYLKTHGDLRRNAGDVHCGGLVAFYEVRGRLYNKAELREYHRLVGHYQDIIQRINTGQNIHANMDLSIKYLRGYIDEKQWKILLQRREKKRNCDQMYVEIINTFINVGIEYFQQWVTEDISDNDLLERMKELNEYTDAAILRLNKLFVVKRSLIKQT
jgi:hypothetical protein